MDLGQSRTARLAAALVARHEVAEAMRVLNGAGILPMPLKGVLLQQIVYQDPADRILADADLLVPPGRFAEAVAALRRAGHAIDPEGRAASTTRAPGAQLRVDLHRRPFAPGLYGLDGQSMFARGRIDETLFDAVVVVPDPVDLFAHLVGNFAKGRHAAESVAQLRDFSAVASRFALGPLPVARHLEAHGLARAARYALAHAPDSFTGQVLAALRPDAVGEASAALARRITARFGGGATISAIAPHLVNRTLPRGVLSAGAHAAIGLRHRLVVRLRGDG
ncbi:MAG: nucleotidyltransferase family protein [Myxococcales bacterium]|nr:nucleotidyltransferase family protein [Myxococcales bacterium]